MSNARYAYKKTTKQLTSWSYSRYRDYKRCPLFAKLKHLDKVPEGEESEAMRRGSAIGAMAEDYVKGVLKRLPPELRLFRTQFADMRKQNMVNVWAEESWCFDHNWHPVEWNDWNNVWLRVKMDLCRLYPKDKLLVPIDHKTGKYRENELGSYLEQLDIYALGGFLKFPDVQTISPRLWFLDEGVEYPQINGEELVYDRSELPALKKKWLANTKAMFADKSFKPKPNDKCRWCAYSCAKGGSCKF